MGFSDEIEELMKAPLPTPGSVPQSFSQEIDQMMTAPLPPSGVGVPTLRQEGPPSSTPETAQALGYGLGRMATQAAGTIGGAAWGGPLGAITGSTAAGQGYDWAMGGQPSVEGAAADAVAGAVGPLAARVGPMLGRWLTGLSPRQYRRITDIFAGKAEATADDITRLRSTMGDFALQLEQRTASGDAIAGQSAQVLREMLALPDARFARSLTTLGGSGVDDLTQRTAGSIAADLAGSTPASLTRMAGGGLLGGLTGDPVIGGLLGAGIAEGTLSRAIPRLLDSPVFVRWALRAGAGRVSRTEMATSLASLSTENEFTPQQREALGSMVLDLLGRAGTARAETAGAAPARRGGNPFANLFVTPQGGQVGRGGDGRFMSLDDIPTLSGDR